MSEGRVWAAVGAIAGVLALPLAVVLALHSRGDDNSAAPGDGAQPPQSQPAAYTDGGSVPGQATGAAVTSAPPATTKTTSKAPSYSPPVTEKPTPRQVSMGVLCNGAQSVYICGTDYGGTAQVGDQVFTYAGEGNGFATEKPPNWGQLVRFAATTCTKLEIDFAARSNGTGTANIRVIQSNADPQETSTPYGTVGHLSAELNGSPWYLQYNTTGGGPVVFNGYGTCTTGSGK